MRVYREFQYRSYKRYMQYLVTCIFVTIIFIVWAAVLILKNSMEKDLSREVLLAAFIATFVLVAEMFVGMYSMSKSTKNKVALADDFISCIEGYKERKIYISDIQKIDFPAVKWVGEWIGIKAFHEHIKLTADLDNAGELVKAMKQALDEKGKSESYENEKLCDFFKIAASSDRSWERFREKLCKVCGITVLNMLASIFIGLLFLSGTRPFVILVVASAFGPLIFNTLAECVICRKESKAVENMKLLYPKRDKENEKIVYRVTTGLYTLAYIMLIIVVLS
jgi:hypothetical protein